jgi:hypothetical protein
MSDIMSYCAITMSSLLESLGAKIPNHGCWFWGLGEAECPMELLEIE